MDLNKHVAKNDGSDHFHSSGIARIQNGGRFGAISKMTFAQRQEIEKKRRLISGYSRSLVANASNAELRNKTPESLNIGKDVASVKKIENIQRPTVIPPRKYDPYS